MIVVVMRRRWCCVYLVRRCDRWCCGYDVYTYGYDDGDAEDDDECRGY